MHHQRGIAWNLVQPDGREPIPPPFYVPTPSSSSCVFMIAAWDVQDDDPKVLETRQAAAAKQPTTLLIMANTQMLNCILRTIQNLLLSPQCSARRKWPKIAGRLSCTCRCASARFSTFPRIP